MRFIKGVIVGTALSATAWMLYNESKKTGKNMIMKKGKKFMKNLGMM